MKHPRFARNPRVSATVHALSGGLNVGTDKTLVGDTQLTDVRDMEWKDGALRTRDGFVTDGARFSAFATGNRVQYFTDRDGYLLAIAANENDAGCDLSVTVFDENGIPTGGEFLTGGQPGLDGFFVAAGSDERFLRYTSLFFVNNGDIYGVNAKNNVFEPLHETAYEPVYLTNGTPTATRVADMTGDRVEPFNMLTEWFRCTYTPDGEGVYYALPPLREGSDVHVTCGELSWELSYGGAKSEAGGYTACVDYAGCVWFEKGGTPCALPAAARNALTVRAQRAYVAVPRVTDMRFGTWYGGDRSATAGGTRLFLGGGHHVIWSAPNDPLYFPVTAYVSLGDPDEALTAFGKQGELLVLFKEHSVYAAEYVRSDTITAQDVQSGAVTDITATAVFPITPVHAEIGCDLPRTVALLGNRLVWACADGTVYALSAGGALAARTVSVLSDPVRPLLKAARPTVAAGVTAGGVYRLLWDNTLFLLTDDGRWTRFSFAQTRAVAQGLCRVGGTVYIPATYAVGGSTVLFWFRQAGETDTVISHTGEFWGDAVYAFTKRAVRGMFCTKQFDLGAPAEYKHLTHVFADATASGAVNASYVTERGQSPDVPHRVLDGVRLTPALSRCRRFALRLEGERLTVGSITFRVTSGRR